MKKKVLSVLLAASMISALLRQRKRQPLQKQLLQKKLRRQKVKRQQQAKEHLPL